jgi:hypothetical protein
VAGQDLTGLGHGVEDGSMNQVHADNFILLI